MAGRSLCLSKDGTRNDLSPMIRNKPGWPFMFRKYLGSIVLSLCCFTLQAEDWVPVYEEPRHKPVFENDHAMILNVFLPPGYVSLYHEHRLDLLYVTIVGTKVWAEPLGGERGEKTGVHTHHLPYTKVYLSAGELSDGNGNIRQVEAGDFLWQVGGETHSYTNTGDNEITIIEMLWR